MHRRDPSLGEFALWRLTHPPMMGAEEPPADPPADPPVGGGKTFTQSDLDQVVKDRLARERAKFADYDDLKAKAGKLADLENASKSDLERLTGERDSLKGEKTTLAATNLRLKVALKKGLVGDKAVLADRLSGDTEEAMEKDADELLKLLGGSTTTFDGGTRGNSDKPQSMDDWIRRAAGRT